MYQDSLVFIYIFLNPSSPHPISFFSTPLIDIDQAGLTLRPTFHPKFQDFGNRQIWYVLGKVTVGFHLIEYPTSLSIQPTPPR
jgi:hypothetical protein